MAARANVLEKRVAAHPGEPLEVVSYIGTSVALTCIQEGTQFYSEALQNPDAIRAQTSSDVMEKLGSRLAYPLFRSFAHSGICKCIWIGLYSHNKDLAATLFSPTPLLPSQRRMAIDVDGFVSGRVKSANKDAIRSLYAGVVPSAVGLGIDWVEIAAEFVQERATIAKQKKEILAAEKDEARRAKRAADMERRIGEISTEHLMWAGRVVIRTIRYQLSQGASTWVSSVLFGATAWDTYAETIMGLVGAAVLM